MLKLKQNSFSVSMGKSYLGSLHDMTIQIPHYSHREHTNSILSHDIVSSHNIKMWWKVSVSIQWICYRLFQLDPLFWSWLIMTKIHVYVYVVTESHNCISKCLSYTSNLISGYIFNLNNIFGFNLLYFDSQFPFSSSQSEQRKLRVNLG